MMEVQDEENVKIRIDHYQTPTQVHVSLFGKGADKAASSINFDYWEVSLILLSSITFRIMMFDSYTTTSIYQKAERSKLSCVH